MAGPVTFHSLLSSLLLVFYLAAGISSAQSLQDALSAHSQLSSFQQLLANELPQLYKTLAALEASTDPVTIVAPSNAAFKNIANTPVIGPAYTANNTTAISDVILYHCVAGVHTIDSLSSNFQFFPTLYADDQMPGGQRVGAVVQSGTPDQIVFTSGLSTRSSISTADVVFQGGVIQITDSFLVPPIPFVDTAEQYNLDDLPDAVSSFIGALYSDENNRTLATYLNETSAVTIFLPINVAMELVSSSLEDLETTSNSMYWDLLSYHVLNDTSGLGPLYSSNFTNNTYITTLEGSDVRFLFESNAFFVNSAHILVSDLLVANGVMHVIDNVLSPADTTALPNPTSATQAPVLSTMSLAVTTVEGIASTSFNISQAPYTTWLPEIISIVTTTNTTTAPTSTATASQSAATESGSGSGSGSPKKKSGATPVVADIKGTIWWALLVSVFFGAAVIL